MKTRLRHIILGLVIVLLIQGVNLPRSLAQSDIALTVLDNPLGVTTQYIGAVEGNTNFDRADLQDLGINTYRIYGGMSRWEAKDDDSIYGYPSIAQIKADPDVINWTWWDTVMTTPPDGSDYWWSGQPGTIWQGNARTMFSQLQQAHIRPVLTIRNTDGNLAGDWNPSWALQLNPPRTQEDWNEWWEHVFATVYWLNVRNNYQVDEFEIHNEPDIRNLGWGGNLGDYVELVRVARDAIKHVYSTYLPERTYYIHAPIAGNKRWTNLAISQMPHDFDRMNFHTYEADVSGYITAVRQVMNQAGLGQIPIWVGEWGTYQDSYDDPTIALNVLKNLMRMAQPGERHVYGNHLFSLYSWGDEGGFPGLIHRGGNRQLSYYTFRMGIRALQGGKDVLQIVPNTDQVMAMATKDDRSLNILMVNDHPSDRQIDVDVSSIRQVGEVKLWQFSADVMDRPIQPISLDHGVMHILTPAASAIMAQVNLDTGTDSYSKAELKMQN